MPKPNILKFAFFYAFDNSIGYLANMASEERWTFSDEPSKPNFILKNYLEYTYVKLEQENKIKKSTNGQYAAFNTGLLTNKLEDIFAFFEKNRKQNQSEYYFKAFVKNSDTEFLKYFAGNNTPEQADYFFHPEFLIFNPKLPIYPDYDHIIEDNKKRFPVEFQMFNDEYLKSIIEGSITTLIKKVRNNYKLAVPQYYDKKIQLLLPLSISGSSKPDLALVLNRSDDHYRASTCLTIKMAYGNARLIVKPESNWLQP